MNKSVIKKILFLIKVAMIVVGAGIILNPWYSAWRYDMALKQAIELWRTSGGIKNSEIAASSQKSSVSWSSAMVIIGDRDDADDEIWDENINPLIDIEHIKSIMDGIIIIDKINLRVPIIKNLTVDNLNISICSVIETNHMGQTGNYVLAGHKSRIFGRHFNRLSEINAGDIITVENGFEVFQYQVVGVFTVMPSDVWVMNNDGEKKIITLITCDYRTNPIGRLIVRGELIERVTGE